MPGDNNFAGEHGQRPRVSPRGSDEGMSVAEEQGRSLKDDSGPSVELIAYWRLMIKRRLLIIGCFLAFLAIGTTASLLMTPIYKAEAKIQIDREAARVFTDEESTADTLQGIEFFETQYGLLRSRSLAERVIESLGLANSNETLKSLGVAAPASDGTAADNALARRAAALRAVQKNLSISPIRGSRLVVVGYDNPDPVVAARIANAFAENFIQSNLERKFESSSYAREFLEERITQTEERLESSERQLVAYAANQQIINVTEPGEAGSAGGSARSLTSSNLVALNGALATARADRIAAEERWRSARSSSIMSVPEVLQNSSIQRFTEQRAELDGEYQQKLSIYQPDYPEMVRLRARIDELDSQIQATAENIRNSIQNNYQIASNKERSLQAQVTSLTSEVLSLRGRSIQYNILQRELDTSRTLYEGLLQRYKEIGITGGITTNNISIVDLATPPKAPSKPNLLLNIALAALIGLGIGVLAAFVSEALDETLATTEDVEAKLGINVLGVVPRLESGKTVADALGDVRSGFSESYYALRTALQFSTPDGVPSSLLITSSRPGEGKSTSAYALAVSLARVGKRVLLADGDLRNPSLHRTIGVGNERGMSNLLSGSADLASIVQPTSQQNLFFCACGPLPPNPAELWGGDRLRQFLIEAGNNFDHVIIDGPPVLGFADSPMLSDAVKGVLFVLESRSTRRGQARGAIRRILVGRSNLLGSVLTKFSNKAADYGYGGYDYAYNYHYGPEPDARIKAKKDRG